MMAVVARVALFLDRVFKWKIVAHRVSLACAAFGEDGDSSSLFFANIKPGRGDVFWNRAEEFCSTSFAGNICRSLFAVEECRANG